MAEQAKDFSRGKISKPLAQEIIKYINDPIARSDFEHSYDTMLDINRAHVLMLCKQHIISEEVGQKILKATDEIQQNRILPDFSENIEDLYTNLEGRLIKMVGMEVGDENRIDEREVGLRAVKRPHDVRRNFTQAACSDEKSVIVEPLVEGR